MHQCHLLIFTSIVYGSGFGITDDQLFSTSCVSYHILIKSYVEFSFKRIVCAFILENKEDENWWIDTMNLRSTDFFSSLFFFLKTTNGFTLPYVNHFFSGSLSPLLCQHEKTQRDVRVDDFPCVALVPSASCRVSFIVAENVYRVPVYDGGREGKTTSEVSSDVLIMSAGHDAVRCATAYHRRRRVRALAVRSRRSKMIPRGYLNMLNRHFTLHSVKWDETLNNNADLPQTSSKTVIKKLKTSKRR